MYGFGNEVTVSGTFEWDGSINLDDIEVSIGGNNVGDFDDAKNLLTEAIDALESLNDRVSLSVVSDALSAVQDILGDVESAESDLGQ